MSESRVAALCQACVPSQGSADQQQRAKVVFPTMGGCAPSPSTPAWRQHPLEGWTSWGNSFHFSFRRIKSHPIYLFWGDPVVLHSQERLLITHIFIALSCTEWGWKQVQRASFPSFWHCISHFLWTTLAHKPQQSQPPHTHPQGKWVGQRELETFIIL